MGLYEKLYPPGEEANAGQKVLYDQIKEQSQMIFDNQFGNRKL